MGIEQTKITRLIIYELLCFQVLIKSVVIENEGECWVELENTKRNRDVVRDLAGMETIELVNGDIIGVEMITKGWRVALINLW